MAVKNKVSQLSQLSPPSQRRVIYLNLCLTAKGECVETGGCAPNLFQKSPRRAGAGLAVFVAAFRPASKAAFPARADPKDGPHVENDRATERGYKWKLSRSPVQLARPNTPNSPQNVAFNEANRFFRINKSIRKSENNEAKSIPGRTQFPSLGFSGILIYRQAM